MKQFIKIAVVFTGLTALLLPAATCTAEEVAPASQAKPVTTEEIAAWIKDLDDAKYKTREQATQHLLESGAAALDPLLAAANADHPEPADRAVWVMRRLARSRDNELAMAALERLVKLHDRSAIVVKAEADLSERRVNVCQQRLEPLGAEIVSQLEQVAGINVTTVLVVRLGEKWHGTVDDLRQVAALQQVGHFRLEGQPVDDEIVKLFAEKEKLEVFQLFDTKVTLAAVDHLKAKHPDAVVYVRNKALLGVMAENHASGALVTFVQQNSAAANCGILPGDVITVLDGRPLPDFDRLTARIAQHQPGDKIDVEIIRNEKRIKLTAVLSNRPEQE